MRRLIALLCFAACLSIPLAVRAQETSTEAELVEARALFEAGAAAFHDVRYEDALGYFERSYQLSGHPTLLYNLGITCERLGRDAEALAHFRGYLEGVPDAENRRDVEGRIAMLERRLASTSEPTPEPAPSSGIDPAGLALVIAGGAVAIGGGVLVGVAAADRAAIEGSAPGTPWSSVSGSADQVPVLSGVGWAALGVGAACAVTGVVLMATAGGSSSARARLSPLGVIVEGSF